MGHNSAGLSATTSTDMGAGYNLDQFNVQLGTGQGSSRTKSTQALSQDTALAMSWLGQTGQTC